MADDPAVMIEQPPARDLRHAEFWPDLLARARRYARIDAIEGCRQAGRRRTINQVPGGRMAFLIFAPARYVPWWSKTARCGR